MGQFRALDSSPVQLWNTSRHISILLDIVCAIRFYCIFDEFSSEWLLSLPIVSIFTWNLRVCMINMAIEKRKKKIADKVKSMEIGSGQMAYWIAT